MKNLNKKLSLVLIISCLVIPLKGFAMTPAEVVDHANYKIGDIEKQGKAAAATKAAAEKAVADAAAAEKVFGTDLAAARTEADRVRGEVDKDTSVAEELAKKHGPALDRERTMSGVFQSDSRSQAQKDADAKALKELDIARKEIAAAKDRTEKAQANLKELDAKVKDLEKAKIDAAAAKVTADKAVDALKKDYYTADYSATDKAKYDQFFDATGKLFDKYKSDYMESELLFRDVKDMKNELKLDNLQLKAMQDRTNQALNNTFTGQFVNNQIKKAMAEMCKHKDSCTAEDADVGKLQGFLNQALGVKPYNREKTSDDKEAKAGTSAPADVKPTVPVATGLEAAPSGDGPGTRRLPPVQ